MSTITNLNRFRKRKSLERKRAQADVNAANFGRSKEEKDAEKKRAEKARRDLDSHRRET